uniref:Uncharacterized protein n=1 Tax=Acrobeloides nanus TaxID=290746 RepID=A0A914EKL7_9BILA
MPPFPFTIPDCSDSCICDVNNECWFSNNPGFSSFSLRTICIQGKCNVYILQHTFSPYQDKPSNVGMVSQTNASKIKFYDEQVGGNWFSRSYYPIGGPFDYIKVKSISCDGCPVNMEGCTGDAS